MTSGDVTFVFGRINEPRFAIIEQQQADGNAPLRFGKTDTLALIWKFF